MARQFTSPISPDRETEIDAYLGRTGAGATKTRLEEIREVFDGVREQGIEEGWTIVKIIEEFEKGLEGDVITGDDGGTKSAEYIKNLTGSYLDEFIADAEGMTTDGLEEDIKTDQGEKAVEIFSDTGFEGEYEKSIQNLDPDMKEIVIKNIMKENYSGTYLGGRGRFLQRWGGDTTPESEEEHQANLDLMRDRAKARMTENYGEGWEARVGRRGPGAIGKMKLRREGMPDDVIAEYY